MKILHVAWFGPMGGVESYMGRLLRELERTGHEDVLVVAGEPWPGLETDKRPVYYLPELVNFSKRAAKPIAAAIADIVHEHCPDVAFMHTAMNIAAARKLIELTPSVFFAHNYGAICPSGALLFQRTNTVCPLARTPNWRCFANAYVQKCNTRRPGRLLTMYRRAQQTQRWAGEVDAVVCGSQYVADRHAVAGFDPSKLYVAPYPVDPPSHDTQSDRSSKRPIILFSGRLVPQKGLDVLMEALPLVRSAWQLRVAGEGPELAGLVKRAANLGLGDRVRFLGRVSRDGMTELYEQATLVVVPSVWPEPMGMVGPEAFAYSCPVIASGVGGIEEWLIHDVTGIRVTPGDSRELALAIDRLLSDPDLAARLARGGRSLVEQRFLPKHHVELLLSAFGRVITARRVRGKPAAASFL